MLRMKSVNLQHSCYKHVSSKSIIVENNVDSDQTASMEASCPGSTELPKGSSRLSMTKLKSSYIIIGFLINVQVQGHHPHQWAPFQVTG